MRLHFLAKPDKESGPLRRGELDFETGVIGTTTAPELHPGPVPGPLRRRGCTRTTPLRRHLTVARYAAARHVLVSRRGQPHSPIDEILAGQGRRRTITTLVPGFATALAPWSGEQSGGDGAAPALRQPARRSGHPAPCPFRSATGIRVALLWHPSQDADPGHRWLRP